MSCSVATCKYVGGALRPHRSVRRPARCSREDSISGFWTFPRVGDPQIVESAHVTAPFPTLSVVSVQPAANPQAQAADITNAAEAHGGVPAIITIKGRLEVSDYAEFSIPRKRRWECWHWDGVSALRSEIKGLVSRCRSRNLRLDGLRLHVIEVKSANDVEQLFAGRKGPR